MAMCGFAGLLQRSGASETELLHWAEVMAATLVHRGPDDAGQWAEPEGGISFGFRRLAIIDLSPNGHQPMRSPSGRYTLVFNGEVFNHRELRQELTGSGATFRGHSDTALDLDAVTAYLRYLCVPAPATIFRHTRKLLPGHLLTIRGPDEPLPESRPYWSVDEVALAGTHAQLDVTDAEAVEEFDRLLT